MPRYQNPADVNFYQGEPTPNGRLFFFESNTSAPKATFADVGETIQNPHPVLLDAAGREPNIFYSGSAKVVLQNELGEQVWERDPVGGESLLGDFSDYTADVIYSRDDIVQASDGNYYISITNNNINNDPVTDGGTNWATLQLIQDWTPAQTYQTNQYVFHQSGLWRSLIDNNVSSEPSAESEDWESIALNESQIIALIQANSVDETEAQALIDASIDDTLTNGLDLTKLQNAPVNLPLDNNKLVEKLHGDLFIDRASPKNVIDQYGRLVTFGIDELAVTNEGALIEPESDNICLASEDLTNETYWIRGTNPFIGTTEQVGDLLLQEIGSNNTGAQRNINQNIDVGAGEPLAISLYFKIGVIDSGEHCAIKFQATDGSDTGSKQVTINKNDITITNVSAGIDAEIETFPNDLYRIKMVYTDYTDATTINLSLFGASAGAGTQNGNLGTMFFGGIQVEEKDEVTSYIKTEATHATRPADKPYIPVEYNLPELTNNWCTSLDLNLPSVDFGQRVIDVSGSTFFAQVTAGGGLSINYGSAQYIVNSVINANEQTKLVINHKDSVLFVYVNSVLLPNPQPTDYDSLDPTGTIYIGARNNSTIVTNGFLKNFRIFDSELTEDEIKLL